MLKSYSYLCFAIFSISSLVAPYSLINKIIYIVMLLQLSLYLIKFNKIRRNHLTIAPIIVISIFLIGFLHSLVRVGNNIEFAIQYLLSSSILLLVIYIGVYNLDINKIVVICGRVVSILSVAYFVSNIFFRDSFWIDFALTTFEAYNKSVSAERQFLNDDSIFKFGAISTVSFLFAPFVLSCLKIKSRFDYKEIFWLATYFFVFFISGRRGLVVISLAFLVSLLFFQLSFYKKILLSTVVVALLYAPLQFILDETLFFSPNEISNSTKIGHFNSFIEGIDPYKFIFGNGLGSYYYSEGVGEYIHQTELTFIDLSRYLGVPLALCLLYILIFPNISNRIYTKNQIYIIYSYSLYIFLSVTNPVLIQSYGMLVTLWYWSNINSIRNNQFG